MVIRLKSYLVRWGLCARCQKAIGTPFDITALHFCQGTKVHVQELTGSHERWVSFIPFWSEKFFSTHKRFLESTREEFLKFCYSVLRDLFSLELGLP